MKIPTRAALPFLASAALLAGGCNNPDADAPADADRVVPQGTSLEPAAPPAPTGGVAFPGEAGADTVPGTPPGAEGAAEPGAGAGGTTPP